MIDGPPLSLRPAPEVPIPPDRSRAKVSELRPIIDAAAEAGALCPVEVGEGAEAVDRARRAVTKANRDARGRVLRSFTTEDGRAFVVAVAAEGDA